MNIKIAIFKLGLLFVAILIILLPVLFVLNLFGIFDIEPCGCENGFTLETACCSDQCYLNCLIVRDYKSQRVCDYLESPENKLWCEGIVENDESICDKVEGVHQVENELVYRDFVVSKYTCKAFIRKDFNYCSSIPEQASKDWCIFFFMPDDRRYCNEINDEKLRIQCLLWQDVDNLSTCNNFKNETFKGQCMYYYARYTGDYDACKKITDRDFKWSCCWEANQNLTVEARSSLCQNVYSEKVSKNITEEERLVAQEDRVTSLCDKYFSDIPDNESSCKLIQNMTQKEECYGSFCSNIQNEGERNNCYRCAVIALPDRTLCTKIVDYPTREACLLRRLDNLI